MASNSAPAGLSSLTLPPQGHNKGRRSSLKPRASSSGPAVGFAANAEDYSDEDDEDPNGSLDMDMTRFETTALYDADGRRKSVGHSRRVSFAPNAHIRYGFLDTFQV